MTRHAKTAPPRVLHVASEQVPFVKTGGLGDVLGALPAAQRALNMDARVLLPGYPEVLDAARGLSTIWSDSDLFHGGRARLYRGRLEGSDVPTYVLDCSTYFARPGNPYLNPDGEDWPDNALRFAALGWVGALLADGLDARFRAPVLHAHDWQGAMSLVASRMVRESRAPCVMTIHNIAYAGAFEPHEVEALSLPPAAYAVEGLEFYERLSFLKGGLVCADQITTVSPTYAVELQTPEQGGGFHGLLRTRAGDLTGILNGVDYDRWSPAHDPALPQPYDVAALGAKRASRRALCERFGLSLPDEAPLFGLVSRLVWQKGVDLIAEVVPLLARWGAGLVVLGRGERELEAGLSDLAKLYPATLAVLLEYDEALAHLVQGGVDSIVVPSREEPCGLTQLYALTYGSPPVVRRTGGLADSIVDVNRTTLEDGTGTGFMFEPATAEGLAGALARAIECHASPTTWAAVQRAGMEQRFDWSRSAARYADVYRAAMRSRTRTR